MKTKLFIQLNNFQNLENEENKILVAYLQMFWYHPKQKMDVVQYDTTKDQELLMVLSYLCYNLCDSKHPIQHYGPLQSLKTLLILKFLVEPLIHTAGRFHNQSLQSPVGVPARLWWVHYHSHPCRCHPVTNGCHCYCWKLNPKIGWVWSVNVGTTVH